MPPRTSRTSKTTKTTKTTKAAPKSAARAGGARRKAREPSVAADTPAAEPSETPEAPAAYTPLQTAIAQIFSQAQKTTAGHRKLSIHLRHVLDECLSGKGSVGTSTGESGRKGEKLFVKEFCRFLERVLVVKKSEVVGDRCLRLADKFVGNLAAPNKPKQKKPAKDKDGDTEMADGEEQVAEEEEPAKEHQETPANRVVLRILNHLLPFLSSKEKAVRYRTTQFLALLLSNSLPEFPFDYSAVSLSIFNQIRQGLAKRLQDKEAVVRVQAAIGLVRLLEMGVGSGSDAEEDSDDETAAAGGVIPVLIHSMQNDPSSDVRRTILYNLSPTPESLPYLLERCRDTDAPTRRSVFTRLLPTLGDFRHLSIGMREKLLRWGLNDRDESVRAAARKMFNFQWVEDAGGDLLEVLERLDIPSEPLEGGAKDLALKGFWEERTDVIEQLEFDEAYWDNLTPESAFLARSFNDYCRTAKNPSANVEEKMPEVTKLAIVLMKYLNKFVTDLRKGDVETSDLEFIVLQLLLIATSMDYGDEVGRRRLFSLLRESLSILELTEPVTKLIVECLAKLSMGEDDFCRLMLEVIAEVHDTIMDDVDAEETQIDDDNESFHSARSEKSDSDIEIIAVNNLYTSAKKKQKKRKDDDSGRPAKKQKTKATDDEEVGEASTATGGAEGESPEEDETAKAVQELIVNLKCLHIAQCMLENVEGQLKSNTSLVTMLNGLVVPAVRSHEAPVRERGLRCLGLSCLLERHLAEENLTLFAHCFNKGHEALQIEALHIISDILLIHSQTLFASDSCSVEQKTLYKMFIRALKDEDDLESVQAVACEVVCKLMLAQVVLDEDLLKTLVIAYFDPSTAGNLSFRQTLTYFFPVFCHSATTNASLMAEIFCAVVHDLWKMYQDLEADEEMVTPTVIATQILDWTDPRKNVSFSSSSKPAPGPTSLASIGEKEKVTEKVGNPNVQVVLAQAILDRVLGEKKCEKEEKKVFLGALAKCYLPADAEQDSLAAVYEAVTRAIEEKVAGDATGRNVLNKIEVALGKIVGEFGRGEDTVLPSGDEMEEDEEEEEGEKTVTPVVEQKEGDPEKDVDMERESDASPAVTDNEDSD